MIFVALISLINYYAQSTFKRGKLCPSTVTPEFQPMAKAWLHKMPSFTLLAALRSMPRRSAALAKVLKRLDTGDALIVTRLDRLARSTRDLLNILDDIAKRGAGFKSLHDAWADTTTPHGRLMLTVLGGLAEFERELILARTGDGRARAKVRGVKFGRPTALTVHQRQEALQRLANGEAQADVARTFNVSQATISRLTAA
jgi:DNA invertase Pin-like site-specific DNA recombinase